MAITKSVENIASSFSGLKNPIVELYKVRTDMNELQAFFSKYMKKDKWIDSSSGLIPYFQTFEKNGGFVSGFFKGKKVSIILAAPGFTVEKSISSDIAVDDVVYIVITGNV